MVGLEDDLRTNEASRIWQSVCHKRAGARNAWKTRPCQPWCSRANVERSAARAWGAKWITVNHTRTQKNKRNDLSGTVINKYLLLRFLGRVLPKSVCRALMGLFPPGLGKFSAPQGPTSCAPGAPLIGQYCLLWGRENQQWPHPCVTCATQKPPGAYNPNSRQQHYTPPTLDSTQQFPQLGRTINNPHPTLPYPSLSDPHSTCTI